MTDDPHHQRFRSLLTPVVTSCDPIARADIRRRSDGIVAAALSRSEEAGEVDLLVHVAAELPLQAAASLIGVPQEDRARLIEGPTPPSTTTTTTSEGPRDRAVAASAAMFEYGTTLIELVVTIPATTSCRERSTARIDDESAPGDVGACT